MYYAVAGHTFFEFSASSIWQSGEYTQYAPYLFGTLMIPSFIAAWFVAYANWQSMLKAVSWIVGLFILTMLVVQIDYGAWGSSLQTFHGSLSEAKQIAFFPIICLAGALLFGFGGKITKISRLMDILFIASVFSLTIYGPDLSWKTSIYMKWGISKEMFLAILLLPSLIVFLIPRKSKK